MEHITVCVATEEDMHRNGTYPTSDFSHGVSGR
jgi:hypothetical protein